jgi:hypothetical protein
LPFRCIPLLLGPPVVVETASDAPASSLCGTATTADGAVGFIDDFESPQAAVNEAATRTSKDEIRKVDHIS